jgi:hypothetical protein
MKKETFELPSLYQDLYNYFVIIDKFYNFTISKKIGKFTITRLKNLLLSTGTIYSEEKLRQLMTICANIIQLAYITEDTKNNTTELEISFPKCSSTTVKGSDKRKKMVYDCIKEYLKKFNDDITIHQQQHILLILLEYVVRLKIMIMKIIRIIRIIMKMMKIMIIRIQIYQIILLI